MSTVWGVFIAILVSACSNTPAGQVTEEHHEEEENNVEFTEAQLKTAGIELGIVTQKQISGTIKVNGVLDVPPQQMVSVSVPFGGFLKDTPLLQGSRVKKGQLIATIENPDYIQLQQDYLEAKNQFEFAKVDYDRQQQLAVENVNAQKTLQQAKMNFQNWQAKTNGIQSKLKMLNIDVSNLESGKITSTANVYATISGFVTEVNVNIGKFVNPTDVLFEIVDTEHLHAELIIFEKDVLKIKIGQNVRFTLANENNERLATVYLIGREISADRTIRIHCHIDKEDRNLLPGMYLKAVVETGGTQVNALPNEAIIDFQGKKYIFIKAAAGDHPKGEEHPEGEEHPADAEHPQGTTEGEHFEMIEITIGNSEFGFTEVVLPEGFNSTNEVVVKGAYAVLSKLKNSEGGDHPH